MLQFDSLRCVKAFPGQQVHLSPWTPQPAAPQLSQPWLRWQQGGRAEGVMLLCSWARVSNPMDSSGSGIPTGATSSAVWAHGKQSHRSCYCWVCLAQQSLCCVTESKCQMNIPPQQQVMGQQQTPAALRSKPRLAHGHMQPCAAQSNGAQESHHGGHTSEHWQPLCVTVAPRCANSTSRPHTWGLWRQARGRSKDSPGPDSAGSCV